MIALRSLLIGGLFLGLVVGIGPSASADDLSDARAKVRKALVATKHEITSGKEAVAKATSKLEVSQAQLAKAKSELAHVQKKLAAARSADAAVAADLKRAEDAANAAAAAVAKVETDLAEQRELIAAAVRAAYQQQSGLVGMTIILGSETSAELAQRLQWSNTIFDSTSAQLDRLTTLEAQLRAAEAVKAAAEQRLAAQRELSAAHVAEIKTLTGDAAAREAKVAALVAANAKLRAAAQQELESSKAQYQALQKSEAKIAAKIRAQMKKDKKSGYKVVNTSGFIKPVNASNGSAFGLRFHPILHYWRMHWGTDFGASCGAPIRAMANGRVTYASRMGGFGNYTIISYGRMYGAYLSSGYAHQSRIIVRVGQKVKQGQLVGYIGTTGLSTGCHLHLQIYRSGVRVNPMRYL